MAAWLREGRYRWGSFAQPGMRCRAVRENGERFGSVIEGTQKSHFLFLIILEISGGSLSRHDYFLPLANARRSSGTGGGTDPPEIRCTAEKREGQASKQVPQLMHAS